MIPSERYLYLPAIFRMHFFAINVVHVKTLWFSMTGEYGLLNTQF